jgi:hypothetical protein
VVPDQADVTADVASVRLPAAESRPPDGWMSDGVLNASEVTPGHAHEGPSAWAEQNARADLTDDALGAFLSETEILARPTRVDPEAADERSPSGAPVHWRDALASTDSTRSRRERRDVAPRREVPLQSGTAASWAKLLWALIALIIGVAVEEHMQKRPSAPPHAGSPTNSASARVPGPSPMVAGPQHDSASEVTRAPGVETAAPALTAPAPALTTAAPGVNAVEVKKASAEVSSEAGPVRRTRLDSQPAPSPTSTTPDTADSIGSDAPAPATLVAGNLPVAESAAIDPRNFGLPSMPPVALTAAVPIDSRQAIKRVLDAYRESYDRLDASSAALIWRGVDTRALARAFSNLSSQALSFDQCDVTVDGTQATAQCRGELRYVRRVGTPTPRVLRLSWTIDLEQSIDRWVIASIKAD